MSFTIVFPGDLYSIKGNPFKIETPFGMAQTISWEDSPARLERLQDAGQFLLDRLDEFERDGLCGPALREWIGHIAPSISHFRSVVDDITAKERPAVTTGQQK